MGGGVTMTAKEAYTKALWNSLPKVIKQFIEDEVSNGKTQVDVIFEVYACTTREANERIIKNLRKLGYTVYRTEDYTLHISWDCVNA